MRLRNHEGLHQKEHHPTNHDTISNYHAITLNCNGIAKLQKIAIRLIGLHQNCTDCMQRRPASERDHQQCSPVPDTENIRTAILAAIFTIELNCGEIAKPQRIARGLKGLHQNPGKSTNCKKTSPIAPESTSFGNRSRIRVRSTQNPGNAGTIVCNPVDFGGIAIMFQATP